MPQPDIVSRWPHEEITKARRRAVYGTIGLAAAAALWAPAFFEDFHSDAFTRGVILETFTVVPLVLVLLRLRRLNSLLNQMNVLGAEEQEETAEELGG